MQRAIKFLLGLSLVAMIVGAPVAYLRYIRDNYRNFHVVHDRVLYRSGQLSQLGLEQTIRQYGIRTIVSLRDGHQPGDTPPDLAEEQYCKDKELNYHRITPRPWSASDDSVPAEVGVRQFLKIVDDPANYPILIHCFAGSHRTGALCAIYRMEYDHWTNQQAIDELRACGYSTLDSDLDVFGYLESYQPRWLKGEVVRVPGTGTEESGSEE